MNDMVQSIWYHPDGETEDGRAIHECVSIEMAGGPKRYMRIWPQMTMHGAPLVEWGWVVHETDIKVWPVES